MAIHPALLRAFRTNLRDIPGNVRRYVRGEGKRMKRGLKRDVAKRKRQLIKAIEDRENKGKPKVRRVKTPSGPVTPEMLGESKAHGEFKLQRGKKGGMFYINDHGKKVYVR